jgi:TPR repeat protein
MKAYQAGNLDKAKQIWKPLAEYGDHMAQFYLSILHRRSFPAQTERSLYWLKKAAQADYPPAQFNLGSYYHKTGQDDVDEQQTAAYWWQRAAERGYDKAQFNLAKLYVSGVGVEQNSRTARYWYQKAANQDVQRAKSALKILSEESLQQAVNNAGSDDGNHRLAWETMPIEEIQLKEEKQTVAAEQLVAVKPESKPANDWVMQQPASHYTMQFMVLSALKSCRHQAARLARAYGLELQVYTINIDNKLLCHVLHGSFSNKRLANNKASELPALQKYWIRPLADLQKMGRGAGK